MNLVQKNVRRARCSVFRGILKMLENGLDGELDDELGYIKYDYRNKEGENSRNGYSKKTLKTSFGETKIKVPRDRNGGFDPQIVKKNQTTLTGGRGTDIVLGISPILCKLQNDNII